MRERRKSPNFWARAAPRGKPNRTENVSGTVVCTFDRRIYFLAASMAAYRLAQGVSSPFLSLHFHREVGLSLAQIGVGIGLLSVFTAAASVVSGILSDRIGRRPLLLVSLCGLGGSALGFAWARDFASYLAFSVFGGLFGAGAYETARNAMVADLAPEEARAKAFGLIRIGGNLGWALGPLLAALLLGSRWANYGKLFFWAAWVHVGNLLFVFFSLQDSFSAGDSHPGTRAGRGVCPSFWRVVRAQNDFLLLLAYSIVLYFVFTQNWQAVPVYARDFLKLPDALVGLLMSTNGVIVILCQSALAGWVDGQKKPVALMGASLLFFLSAATLVLFRSWWSLFLSFSLFFTFAEMLLEVAAPAFVVEISPPSLRGSLLGLYGMAWPVPYAVSPWVAGVLFDAGLPHLLWLLQTFLSLIAFLFACCLYWSFRLVP